jgi:hypothetical protein
MTTAIYAFLNDLGIHTTKGVWPNGPHDVPSDPGETCANPGYVECMRELQELGFEIGYHNATAHTSDREHTLRGLDRFKNFFGHDPVTMSNHFYSQEGIYFGSDRLTGLYRRLYGLALKNEPFLGHVPGQKLFWGDLCKQRIRYVRNFAFSDINTLKVCPWMPYYDSSKPYVNYWYCSAEGANIDSAITTLSEANQDRLEEEGGACILYVHFGHYFCDDNGAIHPRFRTLMTRLSKKNGWFRPVGTVLDHLRAQGRGRQIGPGQRRVLETRWLMHKLRFGSA